MKKPMIILILPIALLGAGCLGLLPHSVFNIAVKTTGVPGKPIAVMYQTPVPTLPPDVSTPTLVATLPPDVPTPTPVLPLPADYDLTERAPTPTAAPQQDPYRQVYFTLWEWGPNANRLVRLPGACLVGLQPCPEPENVAAPFDMKDVFNVTMAGMPWSRDGRYAALTTHPADELMEGATKEGLEQLKRQSPADYKVNPSTLYIFDAQANTWKEIYHADRKYIYTGAWSPDGQWLSFAMYSSVWAFHSAQEGDGVYIIHPDGTGLRRLVDTDLTYVLGWIGSSVVVQHTLTVDPTRTYRIEMLGLDGQVKPLFESSRLAFYTLDPNGGSLLAADAAQLDAPTPQKAVDLLALDGSITHAFGIYNNRTSSIAAATWSPDGSQIAFASQRRAYVAPRDGQPREVFAASDQIVDDPEITNMQFSPDQKYLLMQVYDGMVKLVAVSLEDGQAKPVEWPNTDDANQPGFFSWQP